MVKRDSPLVDSPAIGPSADDGGGGEREGRCGARGERVRGLALEPTDLAGKTLITASNYCLQRASTIDLGGLSESEALAKRLPNTKTVKAFNMLYFKELEDRLIGGGTPNAAMIMAGDDAKAVAAPLITGAMFDVVDAGPLSAGAAFQTGAPLQPKAETRAQIERQLADM
ncbi:MAG: hypothetical protein JJ920_13615 [Roseitalea sp.]|nr:hypothetical protein [Roseitalea sp.]MBO6720799.1 hypothetical protein [Roseitalea sp.]MBO6743946.1 hypothetical protein [Roseitalea sp.]